MFHFIQVIIACGGIICISPTRHGHATEGTLSLRRCMEIEKTLIEWKPMFTAGDYKIDVDELERILIAKHRHLHLMTKSYRRKFVYHFPRQNAYAFIRMLEITHCVVRKWTPLPFTMQFTLGKKPRALRRFSELKIKTILGSPNCPCITSDVKSMLRSDVAIDRVLSARRNDRSLFSRIFIKVKIIFTKIIEWPILRPFVKRIGKAVVGSAIKFIEYKVIGSSFVQRLCADGVRGQIFGYRIELKPSLLRAAIQSITCWRNERYENNWATLFRNAIQ